MKRRSALSIMTSLIGLVKPMIVVMIFAIVLGTLGYLCAIFLTILAGYAILSGLELVGYSVTFILSVMVVLAVSRGLLHYVEQYCNHYIAFKLLAIIRHHVFVALRKLCPAKLEGKDKGNLISMITTDIELLEVFYAHTISPIMIAILTSLIMMCFFGHYDFGAMLIACVSYIVVGVCIPLWNGRRGGSIGLTFRNKFGQLNSFVLDSLRGLDETIQYHQGQKREQQMEEQSDDLAHLQKRLNQGEGFQRMLTNIAILLSSLCMLFYMITLSINQGMPFEAVLICTIAMMGSFGPVVALSQLSNNLNQTLASGERVLSLLEEKPVVDDVLKGENECYEGHLHFTGANVKDITFAYDHETILKNYSLDLPQGKMIGIFGPSGCGKSTLLKLLMRFWEVDQGAIDICQRNINTIPTSLLRDTQSYVTQETHLFKDTIANNIAIGKPNASRDDIMTAAKKASLHDFIMSLPHGYDSQVGELGDTLSGGEKQRIGIARAFLHDSPFLLMDEPTSNLDSLNEGIILKSLNESAKEKTVILVSHRKSTMNVADVVVEMNKERES